MLKSVPDYNESDPRRLHEMNCMVCIYIYVRCTSVARFTGVIYSMKSWYGNYAMDWMVWGSNSGRGKRLFTHLDSVQTGSGAHPASYSVRTWVLSGGREVKQSEREVSHSPPSRAKVKNEWTHTSTPPICLHGVEKENFTFTVTSYPFYEN